MSAEADMVAMLRADYGVQLLVGGRVFLNAADESTPAPYVVVTASHTPTYGLSGALLVDLVSFTLACWGSSADQAELVGDAVQSLIDNASPVLELQVKLRSGGFDGQTTMDVSVLTVERFL